MIYKDTLERIQKENLLIKETFYTKRNIYEAVTEKGVRVFNITYSQFKKLLKENKHEVVKEDYSGFTKRYYKLN